MRIFSIHGNHVTETRSNEALPVLSEVCLPSEGYLWISCTRAEFEHAQRQVQAALQRLCNLQLVDLHVSDLLNAQLPSRYDFTSQYDLLVFRRLAARGVESDTSEPSGLNL